MAKFTVDTHLFRELGELLVGRNSTALIELIKNSYDADATQVIVHGENLAQPELGRIVVMDDGTGMTSEQFTSGFLRIASRLKEQGSRRSPVLGRRYTGVKGIGRLAAHKLAAKIEIESIHSSSTEKRRQTALHATIDWDTIEQHETLNDISDDVIVVSKRPAHPNASLGTTITLSRLRRPWTESERTEFLREVQAFEVPNFLLERLPPTVVSDPILFDVPLLRDSEPGAPASSAAGFEVLLEGELAAGEDYWELMAGMASWVLEIRAREEDGHVRYGVAPTRRTLEDNPSAPHYSTAIPHPSPTEGPFFDARILVREGPLKGKQDLRTWASRASGVRVFLEGFRVLPYGDDDWLGIDADYTARRRQLALLTERGLGSELDNVDDDEGLVRVSSNNYFGGVLLTHTRAPTLRVLVNREGFVPEAGYATLVKLVRTGIDLCTRVRAASGWERRQERRSRRRQGVLPSGERSLSRAISAAQASIKEAQSLLASGQSQAARRSLTVAMHTVSEVKEKAEAVMSEAALIRILASVGTQMAAFAHEMNALLGASQTLDQALRAMLDDAVLTPHDRRRIRQAWAAAVDLKQWLERHASYLIDVVTPDARRRRSRERLTDRFDTAVRLVEHYAERHAVEIHNRIPGGLRSPPMFPAELTTVFANLLTNAVKAAERHGQIEASATAAPDGVRLQVQNTGAAVDLNEAERWFEPFESTTETVQPVLGQGMGLGLTITRRMLDYYGIAISFADPTPPYTTAIEVIFPT